ncbi:MAG TPA: glycoside hydrolase family 92 protein [Phycisphaerales bacterium]|nr:glycoside hydrolase family 92 protein [Phycisphaerales bacterium]HCD32329.1 glycoside hydrolase family 92 protein [Phycisphaerales bacterium]|tara:strand:+ start:13121 stop:15301 length:2181 start_codon:yes stop_codon:yes gene_type:complete
MLQRQTAHPTNTLQLANIFQGSDSTFDLSTGNTYPAMTMPWGMTCWSAQTRQGKWFYHHHDPKFQGLRATHQPSPWIGDYGQMVLMPITGKPCISAEKRSSTYQWDMQQTGPGGGAVRMQRYGIDMQWAVTQHGCATAMHYRYDKQPGMILELPEGTGQISIQPQHRRIHCTTHANHGGVLPNFACHYVIQFDCPIKSFGTGSTEQCVMTQRSHSGDNITAYVQFEPNVASTVTARIASSFISPQQAMLNLDRELAGQTLEQIRTQADACWQKLFDHIDIQTQDTTIRRTFYTALYRCLLFPRGLHEVDEHGKLHHYSPYDDKVHPGLLYTDQGFWDVHRTLYPLLSVVYPQVYSQLLQGWLNAYREGGWLPKWASPGYRNAMCGSHAEAVFADAIVKGTADIDHELAYQAIVQSATQVGDDAGTYGRNGIADYLKLGYVPQDRVHHGVSETLDFAYCDYTISQAARALGKHDDAQRFAQRAQNYRNLFDAKTGYFRGKNADGSWVEPFDPYDWGGSYCEGCANHYLWAVPHDPQGLAELLGGNDILVERMQAMLLDDPRFNIGGYDYEIHEMTEMACVPFGQYAHCNQPVHHMLYLMAHAGAPEKTNAWVRRVLTELYTPDSLPGDEDNGEMSAWYVLSALGLYPTCLASGQYTLSLPLVEKATFITGPSNVVRLHNKHSAIHEVSGQLHVNGKPHPSITLDHSQLMKGCDLVYTSHQPAIKTIP